LFLQLSKPRRAGQAQVGNATTGGKSDEREWQLGFDNSSDYLEQLVLPAFFDFSKRPTRANAVKFAGAPWLPARSPLA
jgi:hypothetical protein